MKELNWVERRAGCTIAAVFNQICDAVVKDVEEFNGIRKLCEHLKFQAQMHSDGTTIFIGQPDQIPMLRVIVGHSVDKIIVRREWNRETVEEWHATIGLNDEGRCTLRLPDETEIEQWQFRKKALEKLFFETRPIPLTMHDRSGILRPS